MFQICLKPQNKFSIPAERKRLKMWDGVREKKMNVPIHQNAIDFDTEMLEAISVFQATYAALWSLYWTGTGKTLEVVPLWPTKSLCLPVLLCSALNSTDTNLMPIHTKASSFLPAWYAELACGGIKETPDAVILSKVKLRRLGNGSAFPTGCDQHDFNLTNTGLTTPLQMRFKLGFCTLWYVS